MQTVHSQNYANRMWAAYNMILWQIYLHSAFGSLDCHSGCAQNRSRKLLHAMYSFMHALS